MEKPRAVFKEREIPEARTCISDFQLRVMCSQLYRPASENYSTRMNVRARGTRLNDQSEQANILEDFAVEL